MAELFVTSGVSPLVVFRSLLVAAAAGALLSGLGRVLLGDRDRGGIFATLAILLLVVGADIRIAVLGGAIGLLFVDRYVLPPVRRLRWRVVGRFFSTVTAILLLAIGIQAFQAGTPGLVVRALTEEAPFRAASKVPTPSADTHPDIYLLLLDGHARPDVLRRVFDHDASGFVAALETRGFGVAAQSRTKYALTAQVMAAMFNMRPLDEIAAVRPLLDDTAGPSRRLDHLDGNQRRPRPSAPAEQGYELVALASSFGQSDLRGVDRWIDTGDLNEFEMNLVRRTILRPILPVIAPDWVSSSYRARVESEFRQLAAIAAERSDRPKFVFGHLPSPRAPWVYNADGTPRTVLDVDAMWAQTPASTGLDKQTLIEGYAGQVSWTDRRLIEAVDEIVANSARAPVIVVFGDHGSWIGADGGDIRLRFLPLFAALMPHGSQPFPDDIDLVNLFPILFDSLFGDDIPLVEGTPSYMFGRNEYDLTAIPDPNGAFPVGATP